MQHVRPAVEADCKTWVFGAESSLLDSDSFQQQRVRLVELVLGAEQT